MKKRTLIIVVVIFIIIALPVIFFVLTTRIASPATIHLTTTKTEATEAIPAKPEDAVNLWLLSQDMIYAHKGNSYHGGKKLHYQEIRDFLLQEKRVTGDSLFVVIRKSKYASYKNTVDVLDEMTISNIKNFSLLEPSKEEERIVEILNHKN